ncbi:exported hypothetical protein [Vibrio nigripulchritudo SO65]|nr:exported hypothetical protein [Vibrio nigripulchritudo AM115]CCN76027.1 exported hypothetical protein [Vibrio nigripulchritudo SO65]
MTTPLAAAGSTVLALLLMPRALSFVTLVRLAEPPPVEEFPSPLPPPPQAVTNKALDIKRANFFMS